MFERNRSKKVELLAKVYDHAKHAYRFGFILRYPADKTAVTGYSYEPWHYRFVGREAATEIYLRNLTLEEFLGQVG